MGVIWKDGDLEEVRGRGIKVRVRILVEVGVSALGFGVRVMVEVGVRVMVGVGVRGGGHSYSWGCEKELGYGSRLGSRQGLGSKSQGSRVRVRSMVRIIRGGRDGIRIIVMVRDRISLYKKL